MRFVLTDVAHPRLVLKHGSHFLVLDQSANIPACNTLGYGYYRLDTRHLSEWELALNDAPLSLLSSDIEEGYAGHFLYTNPQVGDLPQQKVTILRETVLSDLLWERVVVENFHSQPVEFNLSMKFSSDFADMFEVRGLNREQRGERMLPVSSWDYKRLFLAYRGEDGMLLETVIQFYGLSPASINDGCCVFSFKLPVRGSRTFELSLATRWGGKLHGNPGGNAVEAGFQDAKLVAEASSREWHSRGARIATNHELFDLSITRGFRDIYILRQPTPKGIGIAAGIPWYCAVFGRDSAITARQVLPFVPSLAREVIEVLAAYQGTITDDFTDERPGRIMHELRLGELARVKQVPHYPYYGTVDATQLWILLYCRYIRWTGDLDFGHRFWPQIKQAVNWLDTASDGGYIYYKCLSEQGLINQGWKDSFDSVMHKDGHLAKPPIAICEAQGYLYAARVELSEVAELLGHPGTARRLRGSAESLKTMFQKDFWMESENYLALALDGDGRQVGVLSSNPGHCLATGILSEEKATAVADRLMSGQLHSGWGIRTLAADTVAFNPISYHNGSIWPHDNAMIAEGLRRMGRVGDVLRILEGLFDVAQGEADFRLPELFCGFDRGESNNVIDYPVSCSPQAWASGSLLQVLTACINLQPDATNNRLTIADPQLPDWLDTVTIHRLPVGRAFLDLSFTTAAGATSCQILRKVGDIRVIIET